MFISCLELSGNGLLVQTDDIGDIGDMDTQTNRRKINPSTYTENSVH